MSREDILQQAHREYIESRVLTAQPVEIIAMLYDVAIRSLTAALAEAENGSPLKRAKEVSKAQEAINELMMALDHSVGASFSHGLASLYAYAQQEILKGHAKQSAEGFRNALSVMTTLQEGWSGVCEQVVANNRPAAEPAYEVEAVAVGSEPRSTRLAEYRQVAYQESHDWTC